MAKAVLASDLGVPAWRPVAKTTSKSPCSRLSGHSLLITPTESPLRCAYLPSRGSRKRRRGCLGLGGVAGAANVSAAGWFGLVAVLVCCGVVCWCGACGLAAASLSDDTTAGLLTSYLRKWLLSSSQGSGPPLRVMDLILLWCLFLPGMRSHAGAWERW